LRRNDCHASARQTALTVRDAGAILPALPLLRSRTAVPNILVADDNPVSLRFFADALAALGVSTELAHDGIETVAQAGRARFDLLLLDARMPGLDGAQALARIRAEAGPSQHAPALATTAEAGAAAHARLVDAGFAGVIAKPVTVDALRATLARHLQGWIGGAASPSGSGTAALDDARALAATGGDASILAALRGLLIAELDALPAEMAGFGERNDAAAARDRLHRLDASAGFCGAPALAAACATLRHAFDARPEWPQAAADAFLAACADVRARLAESTAAGHR
jgi:CheY-like chemotaxis protein/HPt (histidine-containing phosphotransfer) domain-containing protein